MELLPIIYIVTFTIWTILGEKPLSSIFRLLFYMSFILWIANVLIDSGWSIGFPILSVSFLLLALYGVIIQHFTKHNVLRVVIGSIFLIPHLMDPNPIESILKKHLMENTMIDSEAELIIKCDHNKVNQIIEILESYSYIKSVSRWNIGSPNDTELDDYLILDLENEKYSYKSLQQLESITGVTYVEKNEMWEISPPIPSSSPNLTVNKLGTNDPRAIEQWSLDFLDMNLYFDIISSKNIKPVKPAKLFILDSGVNFKHEDLRKATSSHRSRNRTINESDKNGHGTHCAGIAAAVTNNGVGISSFNPGKDWVELESVAVLNRFGFATQAQIISGLIEAADAGADVINMSFGGISAQIKQKAYDDAFQYLKSKNIILIAAAGNSAADASNYLPSGRNDVITVSAINRTNDKAQFSNYISNTNFGIAAPGTSILSSYKNDYATFDGTSMAAPHVSGLAAVLKSLNPELTTEQCFAILNKTGNRTNDTKQTGKCINPSKAILHLLK